MTRQKKIEVLKAIASGRAAIKDVLQPLPPVIILAWGGDANLVISHKGAQMVSDAELANIEKNTVYGN
jgi:hypothetical protein